jgi:hypothetical protein
MGKLAHRYGSDVLEEAFPTVMVQEVEDEAPRAGAFEAGSRFSICLLHISPLPPILQRAHTHTRSLCVHTTRVITSSAHARATRRA